LPGDVYFIISQGYYEFKNKNGIADMLSDQVSVSRISDFTEVSSIMLNSNLKDQNTSPRKVRKLAINNNADPFSPGPRSEAKLKSNFDKQSHKSLNKEALMSLGGDSPTERKLKDYAESLKSGVKSAYRRRGIYNEEDDDKSLNRFPSIQKSRVGSQHFVQDILSQRSRKSLLSKANTI
jgi:hypothetical protein